MALKGLDAVFYSTFYHLVLTVEMHPVTDQDSLDED